MPPTFKIYEKLSLMAGAVSVVDKAVSPVQNAVSRIQKYNFNDVITTSYNMDVVHPGLSSVQSIEHWLRMHDALDKVRGVSQDYYNELYNGLYKQIDQAALEVINYRVHSGSYASIQALKAQVRSSKRKFKKKYFEALQTLRELLDSGEFNQLMREISDRIKPVRSLISRMHGKLRAVSKRISLANGSVDTRVVYRKKYNVLFKRSDDEDLNK